MYKYDNYNDTLFKTTLENLPVLTQAKLCYQLKINKKFQSRRLLVTAEEKNKQKQNNSSVTGTKYPSLNWFGRPPKITCDDHIFTRQTEKTEFNNLDESQALFPALTLDLGKHAPLDALASARCLQRDFDSPGVLPAHLSGELRVDHKLRPAGFLTLQAFAGNTP